MDLLDRVPPQNLEAESSVLGAILLDNEAAWTVARFLKPENFYKAANRQIYAAILELIEGRKPVDLVILKDDLARKGALEAIGGAAYLAELVESVPSAANVEHYAALVRDRSLLRSLIGTATEIVRDAYEADAPAEEVIDRAEKKFFETTERRIENTSFEIRDILIEEMNRIEAGVPMKGLMSHLVDLDGLTNGFKPAELIIMAARPSMGKCLAFDSEILLEDGRLATIEEIFRARHAKLLTLGADWKLGLVEPSDYVDDGVKPVFHVTTRLGRAIETTLTHPFLTIEGWKPLAELRAGARVAVPRKLPVFGSELWRPCEVTLLAYFIGDGGLTGTCPCFTNSNPEIVADFHDAIGEFGGVEACLNNQDDRAPTWRVVKDKADLTNAREAFTTRLCAALDAGEFSMNGLAKELEVSPSSVRQWVEGEATPNAGIYERLCEALGADSNVLAPEGAAALRYRARNRVTLWLDKLGLMGKGAAEKTIPPAVFRLSRPQLALFLNRLFSTDGWATLLTAGQSQLGYSTTSERLASQVQHLLLRFGVIASKRRRSVKYQGGRRTAWQLDITDARSIETFASEISILGKERAVRACREAVAKRRYQTNRDLVPVEIWDRVGAAKGDESWSALARRAGIAGHTNVHVGKRAVSRARLSVLAAALEHPDLANLAASDVYWDEIVSIEAAGSKQVYDLTIPATHNFVANDICVHNTSLATTILRNIAMQDRVPVAFFSLEMSRSQVVQNMLCQHARVDSFKMRQGRLDRQELSTLGRRSGELAEAPIYIDDASGMSVMELRAKARLLKLRSNVGLIAIDYLQLMEGAATRREENRQQEISQISRGLKQLARELNVPVIALSQLSRAVESRDGNKPRLSDLRESGSLEQDADMVLMLYREAYYKPEKLEIANKAEVLVAKNRNGPTGTAELFFQKTYTRFDNGPNES